MEDPGEGCEDLRQTVTQLLILVEKEKDPERREMLDQRKKCMEEKWMRAIEVKDRCNRQKEVAKKLILKSLDKENQKKFLEWVG